MVNAKNEMGQWKFEIQVAKACEII